MIKGTTVNSVAVKHQRAVSLLASGCTVFSPEGAASRCTGGSVFLDSRRLFYQPLSCCCTSVGNIKLGEKSVGFFFQIFYFSFTGVKYLNQSSK